MAQVVIREYCVPAVLQLVLDGVITGHSRKERTLIAANTNYFWSTMLVDIDSHVSVCVKCTQSKGTVPRLAPILNYPPP